MTAIPTSINSADIGTKALARARMRGLMFMVDDDNRELGKDEFRDIERKMLSDKGAKKILSGLKDEYRMALVAFANVISEWNQGGERAQRSGERQLDVAGASHFGRHRSLEPGAVAVEFLHQEDSEGDHHLRQGNDSGPRCLASDEGPNTPKKKSFTASRDHGHVLALTA